MQSKFTKSKLETKQRHERGEDLGTTRSSPLPPAHTSAACTWIQASAFLPQYHLVLPCGCLITHAHMPDPDSPHCVQPPHSALQCGTMLGTQWPPTGWEETLGGGTREGPREDTRLPGSRGNQSTSPQLGDTVWVCACARAAVEALSRAPGPALTMVHETVVAQAHAKRHRLLPCLAVPLKWNRRGRSEGGQHRIG